MMPPARSYALTDLTWADIADHLSRDSRLIVPVGTCDQYGPHLPIGASTAVVEAVAAELSKEFGVLRAPLFAYGVNLPTARTFAGSATLREKTLHRALNDLLADWELQGFTEFILITAQSYDAHLEAIAGVAVNAARVRVVNALGAEPPPGVVGDAALEHGGARLTSLLLHLRPDLVHLDRASDFDAPPPRFPGFSRNRLDRLPDQSPGCVGRPSHADRATGERIYADLLQKIRDRIFLAPSDEST